ncbi:MAG: sporulation protein YunB [Tissierellia bacterium]|nr:sporulation protein YunB [Tissierellia bacterium]
MRNYFYFLRRKRYFIWIIALFLFVIYMYKYIDKNIKPTIVAVSEVQARQVAIKTINDTIKNKIGNNIKYTDLVSVSYDKEGRITMMQANTMLMNMIASEVALDVQDQLVEISESNIKLPLNNVFDIHIIKLPSIKVRIIPQGAIDVDFATEFESAGINQTRHKIYIVVNTDIKMILPLTAEDIKVTTNIPIAETVIVGDVPETFVDIPEEGILDVIR